MKHITTSSGFELDIDEQILDDMELFDAIIALEKGDGTAVPAVVSKIAGKDRQRLYDHVRTEAGRVPTGDVTREITEIIEALNGKKS